MSESGDDQLHNLRHTLSHLLARAVLEHFPQAKPTLGPPVDDGFYYDIDFQDKEFSEEKLKEIEETMKDLLAEWETFESYEVTADQARDFYADNEYKLELIDDIEDEGEQVTLYYSGPADKVPSKDELLAADNTVFGSGFVDLCKGGHMSSPSEDIDPDGFTLDTVAGAYWRGDEDNQMLTRIYGLAFSTEDELDTYLDNRKEAKKRDHRKLGKQLDLFTFSPDVGSGLPMLRSAGEKVRKTLEDYLNEKKLARGYEFVKIPHIAKRSLYEKSGHMGKYDAMMPTFEDESETEYVMKAMNCPHHFEIYNADTRSYRDLPLRLAENTTVYRNEKSGELHGLTRVKNLTQDDTHHFIRPNQIDAEIQMILDLMDAVYADVGFNDYTIQISVREEDAGDDYFGDDNLWDRAESILKDAVSERGIDYTIEPGEAAFYGPKIDVMVADALDREWQLTTVQLDFVQPDNFQMVYTGKDGQQHQVVVIHAAILGSFERFLGVLLEHTGGDLPFWMHPTQIAFIPVAGEHAAFTQDLQSTLEAEGYRTEILAADDSVGKRIRRTHEKKIPYFTVIGDDEQDSAEIELESRREDLDDISGGMKEIKETLAQLLPDR